MNESPTETREDLKSAVPIPFPLLFDHVRSRRIATCQRCNRTRRNRTENQ